MLRLVFWPQAVWDLSSLNRERTCIAHIGRQSLNRQGSPHPPPPPYHQFLFFKFRRAICVLLLIKGRKSKGINDDLGGCVKMSGQGFGVWQLPKTCVRSQGRLGEAASHLRPGAAAGRSNLRSSGCPGAGGPRGAIPCWRSGSVAKGDTPCPR